jgi:hypothetical protein
LLENRPGNASLPKVVIDPFDIRNALAVWDQYDGQHISVYSSRFQSWFGTWDPPVLVEQTDAEAFDVEIAVDQSGIPIAVWRQQDGVPGLMSVWAARYGGSWSTPLQISDGLQRNESGPRSEPRTGLLHLSRLAHPQHLGAADDRRHEQAGMPHRSGGLHRSDLRATARSITGRRRCSPRGGGTALFVNFQAGSSASPPRPTPDSFGRCVRPSDRRVASLIL